MDFDGLEQFVRWAPWIIAVLTIISFVSFVGLGLWVVNLTNQLAACGL